jgi:hypothetical protein
MVLLCMLGAVCFHSVLLRLLQVDCRLSGGALSTIEAASMQLLHVRSSLPDAS